MKNIFFIIILFQFVVCKGQSDNGIDKLKLETELIKLKNQAFCDCYAEVISGKEKIKYKDGSTYVNIINLKGEYIFGNEKYWQMIKKWVAKDYISYNPDNNLYLMECLDFYNSKELNDFIDSVRQEEIKKNKK